jgi:thiol-disulfide isomerase/thioredoxin
VKLPDLEGKIVELADFRGQDTLVLFWNPGCGFCQQMLPDLKEWESDAPEDAPRLVVVAAGSEEANKEMGLTSPVLLDQQFAVGRSFGASGTPSALLVDSEGKVASEVAVGAPAVLELAGAEQTQA